MKIIKVSLLVTIFSIHLYGYEEYQYQAPYYVYPAPLHVVTYPQTFFMPPNPFFATYYTDAYGNPLPTMPLYYGAPPFIPASQEFPPIQTISKRKHKPKPVHNHDQDSDVLFAKGHAFSLSASCLFHDSIKYPTRRMLFEHDGVLLFFSSIIKGRTIIKHLPDITNFRTIAAALKLFLITKNSSKSPISAAEVNQIDPIPGEILLKIESIAHRHRGNLNRLIETRQIGALLVKRELPELPLSFLPTQSTPRRIPLESKEESS